MQCPKCHAPMHTYNRNGVQIEQCSGCRGIFLDYGELESLTRLESQWRSRPAAAAAPGPAGATRPLPHPPGAPRTAVTTAVTAVTTATSARRASAGCSSPPDRNDRLAPTTKPPAVETAGGSRVVRDTGIEPVTSSVSGKRSPAELIARA